MATVRVGVIRTMVAGLGLATVSSGCFSMKMKEQSLSKEIESVACELKALRKKTGLRMEDVKLSFSSQSGRMDWSLSGGETGLSDRSLEMKLQNLDQIRCEDLPAE